MQRKVGRYLVQAVRHEILNTESCVQYWMTLCGIRVDEVSLKQAILRVSSILLC
jgi:hypothetical protein